VNPSGKLPLTYPDQSGYIGVPYYRKYSESYFPLYRFGHGLSYTTFSYSSIVLNSTNITQGDYLSIFVNVTNTGMVTGKETVLLYLSDCYASITPEVRMLKRFLKVELAPKQTAQISFTLSTDDMMFIGMDDKPILEAGDFIISLTPLNGTANFTVYLTPSVPPTTITTDPFVFQSESDLIMGAIIVILALLLVATIMLSMVYCNRHTVFSGYLRVGM